MLTRSYLLVKIQRWGITSQLSPSYFQTTSRKHLVISGGFSDLDKKNQSLSLVEYFRFIRMKATFLYFYFLYFNSLTLSVHTQNHANKIIPYLKTLFFLQSKKSDFQNRNFEGRNDIAINQNVFNILMSTISEWVVKPFRNFWPFNFLYQTATHSLIPTVQILTLHWFRILP